MHPLAANGDDFALNSTKDVSNAFNSGAPRRNMRKETIRRGFEDELQFIGQTHDGTTQSYLACRTAHGRMCYAPVGNHDGSKQGDPMGTELYNRASAERNAVAKAVVANATPGELLPGGALHPDTAGYRAEIE